MNKLEEMITWVQKRSNTLLAPTGEEVYKRLLEIQNTYDLVPKEQFAKYQEIVERLNNIFKRLNNLENGTSPE